MTARGECVLELGILIARIERDVHSMYNLLGETKKAL